MIQMNSIIMPVLVMSLYLFFHFEYHFQLSIAEIKQFENYKRKRKVLTAMSKCEELNSLWFQSRKSS